MSGYLRLPAVLAAVIAAITGPLAAQSSPATARVAVDSAPAPSTVTLALAPELPDPDAQAVLIRRAGSRNSVILLGQSSASAANLAAALGVLDRSRRSDGDQAPRDVYVVVKDVTLPRPLRPQYAELLEQRLERLRSAEPRAVDGLGQRARAIDVDLPSRASFR